MPEKISKVPKASLIKQTKKAKHSGVKFWLNDDSYKRLNNSDDSLSNILSLYSIKKTISNFIEITSKIPVKVVYAGNQSYVTKDKVVTISADLTDFDTVVGLSLHESSHISFSELDIYKEMYDGVCSHIFKSQSIRNLVQKYEKICGLNKLELFRYWKNFSNWM